MFACALSVLCVLQCLWGDFVTSVRVCVCLLQAFVPLIKTASAKVGPVPSADQPLSYADATALANNGVLAAMIFHLEAVHSVWSPVLSTLRVLGPAAPPSLVELATARHDTETKACARAAAETDTKRAASDTATKVSPWGDGVGYGYIGYDDGDYSDEWWGAGRKDTDSIVPKAHVDRMNDVHTLVCIARIMGLVARLLPGCCLQKCGVVWAQTAVTLAAVSAIVEAAGHSELVQQVVCTSRLPTILISYLGSTEIEMLANPDVHDAVYRCLSALVAAGEGLKRFVSTPAMVTALKRQAQQAQDALDDAANIDEACEPPTTPVAAVNAAVDADVDADTAATAQAAPAAAADVDAEATSTVTADADDADAPAPASSGDESKAAEHVAPAGSVTMDTAVLEHAIATNAIMQASVRTEEAEVCSQPAAEAATEAATSVSIARGELETMYTAALSGLAVNMKAKLPEDHHYHAKVTANKGKVQKGCIKRVRSELRAMKHALPVTCGSSIFVRADKARPYIMQALITAPEGTPYDSGAFVFDIYCPPTYPADAPLVNLRTTGHGTVRFNPNVRRVDDRCVLCDRAA